jgi:glycosyltransferase involved in cell wall biosynthesis
VSLAVITKNEARNIARCIESCRGLVGEIVVVDSGSTDDTVAIARKLGARVEHHAFDNYGAQKNRALDLATGEWVLNLDADEWLSDALRDEIRAAVDAAPADCASFGFPRHNRICGAFRRFGGWRESRKYRLWRRGKVRWAGSVHEWGEVAQGHHQRMLRAPMMHDLGDDWPLYAGKQLKYARLQAEQMHASGKRAGPLAAPLRGLAAWLRAAVVQGALLEGAFGLRTCALRARYAHTKWRALHELSRG